MWDPKGYANASHAQQFWADGVISRLSLEDGESVLDIGCGDGRVTARLNALTRGETVGIDSSEAMIEYAKQHYPEVIFKVMRAEDLRFYRRFDVIFSNAVLHWVSDHRSVAKGIFNALKSGGRFRVQFGGHGNAVTVFEALERLKEGEYGVYLEGFDDPYYFPTAEAFGTLLKEAGLSDVTSALLEVDTVHPDVRAFREWLRTTWFPYIERIPRKMQESFLDAWVASYLQDPEVQSPKGVHVRMIRLEASGWKP